MTTSRSHHLRSAVRACLALVLALAWSAPRVLPGTAAMVGRSAVAGGIDFPDPYGVWYAGGCEPAQWSLDLDAVVSAADLDNNESAGIGAIRGSGSTPCSGVTTTEIGAMSLSVSSGGLLGSVDCPSMSGGYVRSGTIWSITVSGDCSLNGKPEPAQTLSLTLAGTPSSIGGDFGNLNGFLLAGSAAWN